jgi:peptidylprolyl isomerase
MLRPLHISAALLAATELLATACSSGDDGAATETSVTDIELEQIDAPSNEKPEVSIPAEAPTELVITELSPGSGPAAQAGDTVVVDYVGVRSSDGVEFDNSYDRGAPFPVVLGAGQVIAGWDEGLIGARAGERRQLDIPSDLAYGESGAGELIGPGDALTFVVDVRAVITTADPADAPTDIELSESVGATEVEITDLRLGEGPPVVEGDTAAANVLLYRGSDLGELVNTWTEGRHIDFVVQEGQLLPGLVEGLLGMQAGGQRVIVIPAELAFGENGQADLGLDPNEDVIVVVELLARY